MLKRNDLAGKSLQALGPVSNGGSDDLGFTFRTGKNGDLEIYRHGQFCTRFGRARGSRIALQLESRMFGEQQQLLARLTGNYKRGNERR